MKALYCGKCGSIHSPSSRSNGWRWCDCGQAAMRWTNPVTGKAEVWADDLSVVRVLGLSNLVLGLSAESHAELDAEGWRDLHRRSSALVGSNYLFHTSQRDCWALVMMPGDSGDVTVVADAPRRVVITHEGCTHD